MLDKSPRNKTIDIDIVSGQKYLQKTISLLNQVDDINTIINTTIYGDTFAVLPLLPKKSIDILFVDPPYNLNKTYGTRKFTRKDSDAYIGYTCDWLKLVLPLLTERASVYVCCDWETSILIGFCLQKYLTVRNRITWQREKGRGAAKNWKNGLEDIWFATKSDDYTFNLDAVKIRKKVIAPYKEMGEPKDWYENSFGKFRDTCPSNFWSDITIPFWSMAENTAHPTQKSEKLLAKILLASSNQNDIVLDPFLGSGTCSVVAKKLGRRYIGIEREAQYCIWAEKRLEMAESNKSIQGYDGVFYERNMGL